MIKRTEIYYPDGRVLVRTWEPGTRPAYPWIKRAVEGYIEAVDRFLPDGGPQGRVQAFANEEARLRDMPGNVPGMKALHWPEPPGGWEAFDPDNVPPLDAPTLIGFGQSPEEVATKLAAVQRRWDPVCGPVLIMRGWTEDEYDNERGVEPDDLGQPHTANAEGEWVPDASA